MSEAELDPDVCPAIAAGKRWYSDPDVLRAEVERHESFAGAARAHGASGQTLSRWWNELHGFEKVPDGRRPYPARAIDTRDVVDPNRLRENQEQAELRFLRRRVRQLDKELTNREAVIDRIVEAGRVPVEVPKLEVAKPKRSLPERSLVMPIFDIQYGQLVQPTDTPLNVGGFNAEVFDTRLARYVDAVTSTVNDYSTSHRITETVIALGGDLAEGADIFAGQAWQLERDPARQVVELKEKLAAGLTTIVRHLKTEIGVRRIAVVAVPGNHGKVGGKKSGATPSTMSWDWLAAEWIKDRMRAEPIDLWAIEPGGALLFETADRLFLMIHGDEIRGWGGLPFYGMTRYDGRAMRLTGEVYDYVLMGHHHQPASIPNGSGGEFIVSGDWVGGNNLSRHLAAASTPQQRILFVSRKFGITENVPIYLAPPTRERPQIYSLAEAV